MIYVICPKPADPSGGVWFLSRIVQLLSESKHPARLLQTEPHKIWWDSNPIDDTLIGVLNQEHIPAGSTVIVPEVLFPMTGLDKMRQICFVQNRLWLPAEFDKYTLKPEALVCSRYLYNHMERNYSIRPLGIVRPYLDGFWHPTPKQANRTLVIARRNPYHEKMREMLEADGFPVEYVTKPLTQRELFDKLADCEFMVHLTHPEGWPMQIAEAMRMGTIVCGTTGGGGVEFCFDGQTMMVVADPEAGRYSADDFLNGILDRMRLLRSDANLRDKIWQQAFNWCARYTPEATTKELLQALNR